MSKKSSNKMWGGRFSTGPDAIMEAINASIEFDKRLVGDAEFSSCSEIAGAITPVPGGVGPMTIACLLVNTLVACCRKHMVSEPDII